MEQIEASTMAEMVPEIMLVLESSAKENTNVEKCFIELATELKVCDAKSNLLLLDFLNHNFILFSCSINKVELTWLIKIFPKCLIFLLAREILSVISLVQLPVQRFDNQINLESRHQSELWYKYP